MIKIALLFSAFSLVAVAGAQPARAQADDGALRKSCVKQVRASKGLQKGQPLKGASREVNACIANGGKL